MQNSSPSLFIRILLAVLAVFAIVALIIWGILGFRGEPTTPTADVDAQQTVRPDPIPVTFTTLAADPFTFINRVVEVKGVFVPPDPIACFPYEGPKTDWFLIADGFEMEIVGLAQVSEVAVEGLEITVEGVWRQFEGERGCAGQTETRTLWYLEAQTIVNPNPLVRINQPGSGEETDEVTQTTTGAAGEVQATPAQAAGQNAVPTATATPVPTATATPTALSTATPTTASVTGSTVTPASNQGTQTATPTVLATTTTGSGQGGTLTPTATGTLLATGTVPATSTSNPLDGAGGTVTPATPEPTSTPDPYNNGGYP